MHRHEASEKNHGPGMCRRLFLKTVALVAFIASAPRAAFAFFIESLEVRTVEKETFRFDPATGTIKWSGRRSAEPYRLVVDGMVQKPRNYSYADLRSFPQVNQISDFHCVEGWSVKGIKWGGFRFEEITKRVKPLPDARFVIFHALGKTTSQPGGLDHYVESLPVKELLDPKKQCLLVLFMNGKPLTHDHGAPLRVVSPFDMGYKGAKYVIRIEFSKTSQPGWWTLANPVYPADAPVPEQRLREG
ncbi:MAG: Sulfoxide reductase catalytic subunit YedY precursor [Syntrophorhabdaceae bacterium PtaU1.Bin034]|nr:MAG: Sulfoxide reductase catalytic subunit YedY precursor [Syntrophorhabdaceae bacterium PtaU1.Bin034]